MFDLPYDHVPRPPLPSLPDLKKMSEEQLLALVAEATAAQLRELWALAGIEEPGDREDHTKPVVPLRDWYLPLDVLDAICDRLPEYERATRIDTPSLATTRAAKVPAMAKRRGEGASDDTEASRANPRLRFSLWSPGDHRRDRLSEHARQTITRKRNGSAILGGIDVDESEEWTVAAELAAWRARQQERSAS